MIYGIGTDLARIERFASMWQKHALRCGQRLLAPCERAALAASNQPERLLAKRFAAKEALSKAIGTGVRAPVLLTEIAVQHDALGKPVFAFTPRLAAFLAERGVGRVHLSISDEVEQALAFVVCEQALPGTQTDWLLLES